MEKKVSSNPYPRRIPFAQGRVGFYRNYENSYRVNSYDYKEWERGYNFGYFENLKGLEDVD